MKSNINHICFVVEGYPTDDNPEFAFIKPLVFSIADMGIKCTVISPQSITNALVHKKRLRAKKWIDNTGNGNSVVIYQPKTLTFSNRFEWLNRKNTTRCIKSIIKKELLNPDVVYGHFWHSAVQGYLAFRDKPIVVATGESNIWVDEVFDRSITNDALKYIIGVIAVSQKNVDESKELGLLNNNPCILIAPNAIDSKLFYHYDKIEARLKVGIGLKDTVGVFVGEFSERKGSERVLAAAKAIPELKLLMIGRGELSDMSQVAFKGTLPHDQIVDYLNASDFFVLPTLAEGCSNAIVEAMACGLPIISSDEPFNNELLDSTNSIRINPKSVEEISNAMKKLSTDENYRESLSSGSIKKANNLTINARAKSIVQFIEATVAGRKQDV